MMRACASSLLLRCHRHRYTRDFHIDRAEVAAAGKVERLPVVAAEGDVGGRGLAVDDAAEFLTDRVENPDAAGATAIHVAGAVHLHAVGHAGLRPAQVGKDPVALLGEYAVR